MRPILARKPLSQVGHLWVGAAAVEVDVEAARTLRAARFLWASAVRCFSATLAPVVIRPRHLVRSVARSSQVFRLTPRFFREALRQSL